VGAYMIWDEIRGVIIFPDEKLGVIRKWITYPPPFSGGGFE